MTKVFGEPVGKIIGQLLVFGGKVQDGIDGFTHVIIKPGHDHAV